ncbi:hypothetical protein ES703_27220 [subsurface metagenome]
MPIASGIRGSGRKLFIQAHRLAVFDKVFNEYVDGRATFGDVQVRAAKLKLLRRRRPRRGLPQRGNHEL